MSRHSSSGSTAARRRLPRWLKITVVSALVLLNLVVFVVWWSIRNAEQAFRENATVLEVPDLAEPANSSEPLFMLVIGSDSREGVDTSVFGDFGGARGDVIMIARLDPKTSGVRLLSIPRDTYVPIDGHGENKINAAYAFGGAQLMVKTVRDVFEVPINHYVEVNFAGFQELVDELGGVAMKFRAPARDLRSHLDVPAGQVTLEGFQALAYARSRSYEELEDGVWRNVESSDIGRTKRQQALVLAIISEMKRPTSLTESGALVTAVARHLTVDSGLAESSLGQLAFSMRNIDAERVEAVTLPTVGSTRAGASVQLAEEPEAGEVLAAFRSGRPIETETSHDILAVEVLNGNGVTGSAGRWAKVLTEAGFEVVRVDGSERRLATTEVVVREASPAATALAEQLGFGHVTVGQVPSRADAVVILGSDAETSEP